MKRVMNSGIIVAIALLFIMGHSSAESLDDTLTRAKTDGKMVMLELGSVGCIPCEQMKPVMQKLRDSFDEKLEVVFVDVRRDNKIGQQFGVVMIPTQVFLDKKGSEFHRHIGFYSYEEIVPILKKAGL